MAERQFGPFLVKGKLGSGGMGVVYRAVYTTTGQEVALKVLPEEAAQNERLVARFERELTILKRMRHPHIVRCLGGGKVNTQWCYAMEIVPGGTLAEVIRSRGPLPWQQVIEYGLQICDALSYAHENGVMHRDLKPSNLLLTAEGKLKLSDFGLARDADASTLTATGKTVGSFPYMAPEQARGDDTSFKTDLYGLGCVLFEMLTGRPPFVAESAAEFMYAHLEQTPPRVASLALDCPIWLDAIVARLLEKEPEHRPRDAAVVAQALQEVEENVAAQTSVAGHMVSGEPTALRVSQDSGTARSLLKKKKRKKRETGPFYQRTWFLVVCLLLSFGVIAWTFRPLTERELFEQGAKLMASESITDWDIARDRYLQPMLEKYPQGEHAGEAQEFLDKIEMRRAEERLRFNAKLGRDPTTEGERLYADARRYEQFGDRISALEKYRSMINVLKDNSEAKPFVGLAKRQIAMIQQGGGAGGNRVEIVTKALDRADQAYKEGDALEAHKVWESVIKLYESNRELQPQVQRAKDRLADPLARDERRGKDSP